jgi:hypothetical protein
MKSTQPTYASVAVVCVDVISYPFLFILLLHDPAFLLSALLYHVRFVLSSLYSNVFHVREEGRQDVSIVIIPYSYFLLLSD